MNLVVWNIVARRCVAKRSLIGGVRFDEVLVEGLTTAGNLMLDGCTFRHVTLRGRIASLMVVASTVSLAERVRRRFTDTIVDHYHDVDWALDITEAEFESATLYFVPGDLVRRDRQTQFCCAGRP